MLSTHQVLTSLAVQPELAQVSAQDIGARIRQFRQENKLSQNKLATRLGIKQPSLSQIEQGVVKPSLRVLQSLVHRYELTYEWLIDGHGPMQQVRARRT